MFRNICLTLMTTLSLSISGCSLWSSPPPPAPEPAPVSPVVAFMQNNGPGQTASLADAEFGGEVRVHVEDEFLSAANELCRRATLFSSGHEAEVVVICRDNVPDSAWRLMPRVWGKGL